MPSIKGLEWTFDTVSAVYEKMRPGYVPGLYDRIFEYAPMDENSRAVEIGIGAGQATGPILKTGCSLTAVDIGEKFSQLCREKFAEYPKFSMLTGKFEEMDFAENAYNLVYSASAFHWIPEEAGYNKVFAMLKSGGAFARFANHPLRDKGNPALSDAIDELYQRYYYRFYPNKHATPKEYTAEDAQARADIAKKYGFTDTRFFLFHRTRVFTGAEYISLLGTYSDHIAITEDIRTEFFSKIKQAIEENGGTFTIYDTIDLELARKP